MYIIAQDAPVNLFDAVMAYRETKMQIIDTNVGDHGAEPLSNEELGVEYPLIDQREMFSVPEFANVGVRYVVRTNGWTKKDAPIFWVCQGGLVGRPWAGPFKTAQEAEARL